MPWRITFSRKRGLVNMWNKKTKHRDKRHKLLKQIFSCTRTLLSQPWSDVTYSCCQATLSPTPGLGFLNGRQCLWSIGLVKLYCSSDRYLKSCPLPFPRHLQCQDCMEVVNTGPRPLHQGNCLLAIYSHFWPFCTSWVAKHLLGNLTN